LSGETLFYMALLGLIVAGSAAIYGYLLKRQIKAVWRSMIALRDRIDGTKRWP
jgi:hypothetical protein